MVSILSAVRDMGRLREIYVVLVRHGFGELARRLGFSAPALPEKTDGDEKVEGSKKRAPLAERVRLVAMDLGPSFVKLGQLASTRSDLLPETWVSELKKLQDEVTPLGFDE